MSSKNSCYNGYRTSIFDKKRKKWFRRKFSLYSAREIEEGPVERKLYFGGGVGGFRSLGKFPRHTYYLPLAVCPKVDCNSDQVVDGRVGALVEECCAEHTERVDC